MLGRFLVPFGKAVRGIGAAIRARWKVFAAVALSVFVLNLFLPVAVLSLARKPVDSFTVNPWLSRLPEWLASGNVPVTRKFQFLSTLALAWFSAESDNPMVGKEWGFIVDVPSLVRMIFTSILFGAYFALWFYRRDQVRHCGWGMSASRHGGVAGAVTSVLGLSAGPCSVAGCGVPVLPVLGLAFTGLPLDTLRLFKELSRAATLVVLFAMTAGVAWFGWLAGSGLRDTGAVRSGGA